MITNETRARLIGYVRLKAGRLPNFMLDESAAADLRAFVRARGKEAEFAKQLSGFTDEPPSLFSVCFDVFIDATPAQQCAAFDAVFAGELSRIE